MSLDFVQGDTSPDLEATLTEEDLVTPIPLTGASVKFQMRRSEDRRYTVNATATVVDDLLGKVAYSWAPNDLMADGIFQTQWEITFPGGRIQTTYPPVDIEVHRQ